LQAEIVTIGTELLLGEILDTNSAWIAQRLMTIGLNLFYTTTVGDNMPRMTQVLRQALERSEVVITTGGLGPTVDDMTRDAVAAATHRDLYLDEDLVREIAAYFGRRGFTMTDNNKVQARIPRGARIIHNPVGTAPCFAVEFEGRVIISLPGVPHEMRHLMETEVLPYLRAHFGLTNVIKSRTIRTCGIGESAVGAQIEDLMGLSNPTVGTRAHPGQTDLKITAKAESEAAAMALIAPIEADLRRRLGDFIFGVDEQTLSGVVARLLAERGQTLATVETTTRGELANQLAEAGLKVEALLGGVTVASEAGLAPALGLAPADVTAWGFPSQALADAAAQAVRARLGADYGLAVIGPFDPAKPDAPPVYFSLATPQGLVQGESRQGRAGPSGRGWLIHLASDMVRRQLLG
jgi:nicotinamide-nucleotide amidase